MSTPTIVLCAPLCGLFVSLAAAASERQDARDIMKNADALVRKSRTYQAVMVTTGTTPTGSFSMTSVWKLVPTEHKTSIKMNGNLFGEPMFTEIIDDGKTFYAFNVTRKVFSKGPHSLMRFAYPLKLVNEMLGDGEVSYLKPDILMGNKVHVLKKRTNAQFGSDMAPTVHLYFDQSTGRFVQMTMFGELSFEPGTPPKKFGITVSVRNETLNAPVPESVFKFIPPPGAKETQSRGIGMGPMYPMGPGRMGGIRPPGQ